MNIRDKDRKDTIELLIRELAELNGTLISEREKLESKINEDFSEVSLNLRDQLGIDESGRKTGRGLYSSLDDSLREERERRDFFDKIKRAPTTGNKPLNRDVYKVTLPGGDVIYMNYSALNNLIREFNAYFALFDNPFLDSYNVLQREEIIRGIHGLADGTPVPASGYGSFSWLKDK